MTEDERNRRRGLMLAFVRDAVVERSQIMRSCYALTESPDEAHLKRVLALEAAGDIFTHLVGEWQRGEKDPPGWLKSVAKQGMATFIEGLK